MHKNSVCSLPFSIQYQGTLSTINAVLKYVTLVLYFYFPTGIFQVHLHCPTVSAVQLNSFVRLDPLNIRLARLNIIAQLTLWMRLFVPLGDSAPPTRPDPRFAPRVIFAPRGFLFLYPAIEVCPSVSLFSFIFCLMCCWNMKYVKKFERSNILNIAYMVKLFSRIVVYVA